MKCKRRHNKLRISLLTNMLTPYRVPLFKALMADERVEWLRVLTCVGREVDRQWQVDAHTANYTVKCLSGITLNLKRGADALRILHLRFGIIWELIHYRPDRLIIGDASWTSYLAMFACLLLQVPYVVWNEITTSSKVSGGLMPHLRRFMFKNARTCIASGRMARDFLLQHGCEMSKIVIARNAVDNDFFLEQRRRWEPHRYEIRCELSIAPDSFALLYVGQLISRKRVMETLKAAAQAAREIELHLIIAGTGPLEEPLRQLAIELGFFNITFCGYVEPLSLSRIYVASDGLVLLSDDEPWGMVINEALLFGKPYFATVDVAAAVELNQWRYNLIVYNLSKLSNKIIEFIKYSHKKVPDVIEVLPNSKEMALCFIFALDV